jgi:hypothetical protein
MSASTVPTVTLRPDGSLSVPVRPSCSIVWRVLYDEVSSRPVLQIRVEQEGCRVYEVHEADSASVPIKL